MGDGNVHIDFRRSGGIAGLTTVASVDTDALDPETAARINSALGAVDLAALAARPPAAPSGADRFQYDLAVDQGGRRLSLSIGESAVPPELRPLLQELVPLARPA